MTQYHATRCRSGTDDQIDICTPQGDIIATISYWECDREWAARAETDATLIIDALNAYRACS